MIEKSQISPNHNDGYITIHFGVLLLNTSVGNILISGIADGFGELLKYAADGVNFVFGGLVNQKEFSFFLSVLMPIVFISALIGILQHIKVLPIIVKSIGLALSKVNGMGKLESYNAVASAILGQSEVFISVKKQLGLLPEKECIHYVHLQCLPFQCLSLDRIWCY